MGKLLNDNLETFNGSGGGNYSFSGAKIADLGATAYTLVTIAVDGTPSVETFREEIEVALVNTVKACKYSQRKDSLMLRVLMITDNKCVETHGFKLLSDIDPDSDYKGVPRIGGHSTALFESAKDSLDAALTYGQYLAKDDFDANSIHVWITDGVDNVYRTSVRDVHDAILETRQAEALESTVTILVGVNIQNPHVSDALKAFKDGAGIDQYEEIDKATPEKMARLADFVSKSISAQSNALGTGTASKAIAF